MMTREEILQNFDINQHGIICNPGKFEGEMLYTPHFYDAILAGGSDLEIYDLNDQIYDIFKIAAEDCIYFPELTSTLFLVCFEDDQGFVYCDEFKLNEINSLLESFSEYREDILALL